MKTNDKQYYIYLHSTGERVFCTKEEFGNYYRDINAYRRTQQNHGRCVCPPSRWLMCDMDCWTCPYRTPGDVSSLDSGRIDEEGSEMNWLDKLQEEAPDLRGSSTEEIVTNALYLRQILARLNEIMPQAMEIGRLRQMGLSEDAIAAEIGTGRKTYAYRLKKAAEQLEKEFPEFF